jgi:flagellar motility protein MotE (MotC chaperone)
MPGLRPLAMIAILLGGLFALKSVSLADGAASLWEASAAAAEAAAETVAAVEDAPASLQPDPDPEPAQAEPAPLPAAPVVAPAADEPDRERSGSELALLEALSRRRAELDRRAAELDTREALIEVAEQDVEVRIAEMEGLREEIRGLLGQLDEQRQSRLNEIVTVYSQLEPEEAAAIMTEMDEDTLLVVAEQLQRDQGRRYAAILGAMPPAFAAGLTVRLRARADIAESAAEAEARLAGTGS